MPLTCRKNRTCPCSDFPIEAGGCDETLRSDHVCARACAGRRVRRRRVHGRRHWRHRHERLIEFKRQLGAGLQHRQRHKRTGLGLIRSFFPVRKYQQLRRVRCKREWGQWLIQEPEPYAVSLWKWIDPVRWRLQHQPQLGRHERLNRRKRLRQRELVVRTARVQS